MSLTREHNPALDGLRGIAALMVVAHHAPFTYQLTNRFDQILYRVTSPMWLGVDLFFVLSGYLITGILLRTRDSGTYFSSFYGRRLVRIAPLYFLYLSLVYLVLPLLGLPAAPGAKEAEMYQWLYLSNIYIGFHHWPDISINHLWSLSIEEQFYLVWPLLVWLCSERQLPRLLCGILVLAPLLRCLFALLHLSPDLGRSLTPCRLDGLALGALIALAEQRGMLKLQRRTLNSLDALVGLLIAGFWIVYLLVLRNDTFLMYYATWSPLLQTSLLSVFSAILAYLVLRCVGEESNTLKRILRTSVLTNIGRVSYALYIFHFSICTFIGSHQTELGISSIPYSTLRSVVTVLLDFACSISVAFLSWHLFEKHLLKLKRFFPYGSGSTTEALPALATLQQTS